MRRGVQFAPIYDLECCRPTFQGGREMRKWIWLSLCLVLVPLAGSAKQPVEIDNNVLTMRVDGEIAIDPAGKLLDYRITTPIKPEMQKLLDASVRKWTFHPVVIDGQPVAAKSKMRITLAAREAGSGYSVSVDNVTFRDYAEKKDESANDERRMAKKAEHVAIVAKALRPGGYPNGLMRAGVEGAVLLYLKLSLDGNVENIIAVQSSLYDVRGRPELLDQARKLFEDAAIAAAKRWKFEVSSTKATPTADDLTVTIPVAYVMPKRQASDAPGQWRTELRSEKRIAPWLLDTPAVQNIGISDLDNGDMLPIASAFRAPDGVIGKAL